MVDSHSKDLRHSGENADPTSNSDSDMTESNKRPKVSRTSSLEEVGDSVLFGHVDVKKLEHCARTLQKQIRILINEAPSLAKLQQLSESAEVDNEVKHEIQRNPLLQMASVLKSKYLAKDLSVFDEILSGNVQPTEEYTPVVQNAYSASENGGNYGAGRDGELQQSDNDSEYDDQLPGLPLISNPHLLDRVFIHKSTLNDRTYLSEEELIGSHNERLEFLGDSILNNVVTMIIYERFRHSSEGELLKIRSQLVSNKTLAEFSITYGLDKRLRSNISDLILRQGNQKIYADVFEAYIGALAIEHKMDLTIIKKWLTKILHLKLKSFDQEIGGVEPLNKNAKTDLYLLIGTAAFHPEYRVVKTGDGATKPFIIRCEMGREVLGEGVAPSSKEAGLRAAMQALKNRRLLEKYGQIRLGTDRNESKISSNVLLTKYQDLSMETTPEFYSNGGFSYDPMGTPLSATNSNDASITKLLSSILNSNFISNASTPPANTSQKRSSYQSGSIFPVYGNELAHFLPEAKNDLYAILNKRGIVPQYNVFAEDDKFKGELIILNVLVAIGVDSSKKKAATRAAMALLKNKEALTEVDNIVSSS